MFSNRDKSINYYLGASFTGYFHTRFEDPSFEYRTSETNLGMMFGLSPKLNYALTQKIQLEISALLNFLDLRKYAYLSDDPRLSFSDQRPENWTCLNFIPKAFNFRNGFSYLLK